MIVIERHLAMLVLKVRKMFDLNSILHDFPVLIGQERVNFRKQNLKERSIQYRR